MQALCLVILACTLLAGCSKEPSAPSGQAGPTPSNPAASRAAGIPEPGASQTPKASPARRTLVLGPDSLGIARFGDSADTAMTALSSALGKPDADKGWTDSFSEYGSCPGTRVRGQRWKSFEALFVEGSTDLRPDGKPHLFGFLYSQETESPEPRLVTANGIGLGSTVRQLRSSYGDKVEIFDDTVTEQEAFHVGAAPRELFGLLTGRGPDDRVVFISGGGMCSE